MIAFFRCDATSNVGFGHMSRCIALAEALRSLGIDSNFMGLFDQDAKDHIDRSRFNRIDLSHPVNSEMSEHKILADAMGTAPGSFVVLDSYRTDESYLAGLKAIGHPTVIFDDFNALVDYPCDVLLNFTWGAKSLVYPQGPALLLGPEYFLARRPFVELRSQSLERRRSGRIGKLLVAIGGADPKGIAPRIARILAGKATDLGLRVVAQDSEELAHALAHFAPGSLALSKLPDLSEQLLWADACITGGGLIKYEAAFMGVPAAAVSQNEGQAGETEALSRAGLVFDLGLVDADSDYELAQGLERFLADDGLRDGLMTRIRDLFPRDPSANAARAIVEAIRG